MTEYYENNMHLFQDWEPSMGCNITFSWFRFSNECHLVKDKHRFTFSAYVFVDTKTGKLIKDAKRIANCMRGGYLIWLDLHLALKIVHCSGVVLLFWRGTHERHCTITSEILDDTVLRIGTSIQVNKRLFDVVQKYYWELEALHLWKLNGWKGKKPPVPLMPTDLDDLGVGYDD
ncbi:hypothetical protein FRC12_024244 [Ceratobasidium sp. 428]|nr:hypothetical protein FRC12_024244 [Ceratobasidium sp. 428]